MKRAAWIVVGIIVLVAVAIILTRTDRSSGELVLGASLPLTGEVASYGIKAKRGIEIAVAERNDAGGLLGNDIVVDFQDDQNDAKQAVSIVTKFATVDELPAFFGSAGSTVSLAIAPLANRYGIVQISSISSSEKLSTEGGEYFFRTCPADDLQAEVLANWVYESGVKKVAIVFTNNSWGKPLADGFATKFSALGGQVLLQEGIQENTDDVRTLVTKIKGLEGLEAVVSPTYPKEGGILVRQAGELGLDVPLYGGDNWGSPEFRTIAGGAASGVFYTSPAKSTSPVYEDFSSRYIALHGEEPDVFAAYSYDAALALFAAIQSAESTSPQEIKKSLLDVSFQGASGQIAFKANGDLKSEAFDRMTIQNGQPAQVN